MKKPNYLTKLLRLERERKLPPGLWHVDIRHDDPCGIFRGQRCDCDPEIRFVDNATWMNRNIEHLMPERRKP